jgi:hypothetical protein
MAADKRRKILLISALYKDRHLYTTYKKIKHQAEDRLCLIQEKLWEKNVCFY